MNIVEMSQEKDKSLAALEQLKRDSETMKELYREMAKIKYATYKAYVDEGFTPEQALTLLISG
jgi:hypothetical protein